MEDYYIHVVWGVQCSVSLDSYTSTWVVRTNHWDLVRPFFLSSCTLYIHGLGLYPWFNSSLPTGENNVILEFSVPGSWWRDVSGLVQYGGT